MPPYRNTDTNAEPVFLDDATIAAIAAANTGALPTGASTSARQDSEIAALGQIQTNTAALLSGTFVRSFDETNVLAGRGFSWGTGVQTIPANNYFNMVFANPAGSGKTAYIVLREFGNGSGTVLQAVLRTGVTALTSPTIVNGGNRLMGNANTAVSTLSYTMGTTAITTGALGPALMLEINGAPTDSDLLRIVPPGFNFAYVISGLTGAFAASAQVSFSLAGWEQ